MSLPLDPAYEKDILIDPQWLEDHLRDPGVRIVDFRTWPILLKAKVLEEKGEQIRLACEEDYLDGHIPGAILMDPVADMTEPSSEDIALVASPRRFAEVMGRAGIDDQTLVVVYDDSPIPAPSARFWWTMQYYGHRRVRILEGGFLQWREEGRPLSTGREKEVRSDGTFSLRIQPDIRATKETVLASLDDPDTVMVDTMSYEFYTGASPHPWSIRPGRIPGALCLTWLSLGVGLERSRSKETRMQVMSGLQALPLLPAEGIRGLAEAAGIKPGKRVITYCGKGYGAPTVFLALKLAGWKDVALYDGGIAEWSRDPSMPMEGFNGERLPIPDAKSRCGSL
jgi:thiosulfate/3-mercaptopyruvate sulfurtransferase